MPGSNEYSVSPDVRTNTSESKPTLISKSNPTPETYQMQDFDMNTWVASVLKERYGTDGSNRDFRKLNRYLTSKEGLTALEQAKANHRASEMLKYTAAQQKQKASQNETNKQNNERVAPESVIKDKATSQVALKQPIKPKRTATNANVIAGAQTYKVESGNTLGQIVADYNKKNNANLRWQEVALWNNLDPAKMRIGQIIRFTEPGTSQTTPTEVKSNTTATPTVEAPAPVSNNEKSDSVMVQSMPNINSSDSLKVDSVSRDSALVLPVDTGNVVKAAVDTGNVVMPDSALLSSPDSVSISSKIPVATTRYPRNFTRSGQYFNYPTEQFMRDMKQYRDHLRSIVPEKIVSSNKQGGTMNRINYFQQGGAATSAQQGQADAFMQAILQGDPEAIAQLVEAANGGNGEAQQLIQTILNEEQKRNPKVAKAAQVIKQILGQATSAKWGSKLQYIRSLKYAKGGKACPACQTMKKGAEVEMKKCGGKKMKKRYFGGWL